MATIKCKAAVAYEPNKPMVIKEIEVQAPRKGEVRIKVLFSGVCHTDDYYLSGQDSESAWPAILGHEGGGIVESIGEGVTLLSVGDHVVPLYIPECGDCKFCKNPKTNLCSVVRNTQGKGVMPDGTPRFIVDEKECFHFMGTSTFSQYTVLPEISLAKISKEAPLEKVCLLGCGITTGYGAVRNTLKIPEGSSVMIVGLGGVGLAAIMGSVANKASRIIGVDINAGKFPLAQQFGCTDVVNPLDHKDKTLPEVIFGMTNGEGVDFSIECCGLAHTMKQAFQSVKPNGGTSCIIGVASAGVEIELEAKDIMNRNWTGSAFGGTKSRSQVPEIVNDYMQGKIKVDEFITHHFGLDDVNKAFDVMHEGTCIRAVIDLWK